jgi:hypothetical protein
VSARLSGARMAALRDVAVPQLSNALSQPGTAITLLAEDLRQLWDNHRSDDCSERRIGTLELSTGAYVQWIGYADCLVVEVSSNTYLAGSARLSPAQEAAVLQQGFFAPDDDDPNFTWHVAERWAVEAAAAAVVAALTAAFGVYAG